MHAIMDWIDANPVKAFGAFYAGMILMWIYLIDWRLGKIEKHLMLHGKRLD